LENWEKSHEECTPLPEYRARLHHVTLREPKPEDTEKANRKDIEEYGDA